MARKIRHDIDGLKAIAIIAVVLYHFFDLLNLSRVTNVTMFSGGFLGVDVFFTVSGFLITAGIFYKLQQNDFSLKEFYQRRFMRILPPLFPVCLFSLAAGYFFLFPDVYLELAKEIVNTLIFSGNFRFANSGGYFSMDSSDKVLLHTWYLCITIQFYLIYPVILKLLSKVFNVQRLPVCVGVLTVALMAVSVIQSQKGNGYLLTQCRIWELFFGGAVFLYSGKIKEIFFERAKVLPLIGEITGTAVIVFSIFYIELTNGSWYFTTSILTVIGTALVLLSDNHNSVLKNGLFSIIGKTSYSLYLWHWPILAIAVKWGFNTDFICVTSFLCSLVVLVYLSYRLFEKPQYSFKFVLCCYFVIFAVYFIVKKTEGDNYIADALFNDKDAQISATSASVQPNESVFMQEGDEIVYLEKKGENTPHVFIVGDSHLGHFKSYLKNNIDSSYFFYGKPATVAYGPILSNMKSVFFYGQKERQTFFNVYKSMLSKLNDGDKVILSNRWDAQLIPYGQDRNMNVNDDLVKIFAKDLIADFDSQIKLYPKLKFYILGQGIVIQKEVVNCSKLDLNKLVYSRFIDSQKCSFTFDVNESFKNIINNAIKEYASKTVNVEFIDRNVAIALADNTYRVRIDDKPLFEDDNHLTYYGSYVLGQAILKQLIDGK